MPRFANTKDKIKLYFQITGSGVPIVFVHEYAGDHQSWEPQVKHFSRSYKCVTYNARGYPPSAVPIQPSDYSQEIAREDLLSIFNCLKIKNAHIVGLSMGGFAALHFGLKYPKRAKSLVLAGCGYGAESKTRKQFQKEAKNTANRIEKESMEQFGKGYVLSSNRIQLHIKDPRGAKEFETRLRKHSSIGSANTMRGIQAKRPSLYALKPSISRLTVPTLIINGDEDEPCLNVGLFLKRTIKSSALITLPKTGHASNLEEPGLFNQFCERFFHQVEARKWRLRDPRSITGSIMSKPRD